MYCKPDSLEAAQKSLCKLELTDSNTASEEVDGEVGCNVDFCL